MSSGSRVIKNHNKRIVTYTKECDASNRKHVLCVLGPGLDSLHYVVH